MEELTRTWNSLTLSDCECSNFRIKEEQAKTEFVLAAKFLTKRALNIDAIAKTFTPLWRSRNGFKIKKESDHVVLFSFDDKNEMEKIMAAEPWSFDKRLMVLQRYEKDKNVGDMEFNKMTFWVQVHDLPIRFRTRKIAEQLCEAIGKVNVGTEEAETEGDNFIRVRVTLDITQPLSRGRVVSLDSGKELWVHFRYERLPSLCFWCGCLTHEDRDCELWIASEGSLLPESKQYGPWLKAAPFVASRKYVIKVPGIFNSKTRSSEGKHEAATEKHKGAAAAPVVVVRSGKQVPDIIRLEKESTTPENIRPEMESFEVPNEGNIEPVFQEIYIHDSRHSTEEKVMEDVITQQTGAAVKKESGKSFEEALGEIDKEIKKYDSKSSRFASSRVCTGKENHMGQHRDIEASVPCTPILSANLSLPPRPPLAEIPSALAERPQHLVIHGHAEGTWKRINRIGVEADAAMGEVVGGKKKLRQCNKPK
uniref:DUF4283 domain-containing protein n=1 Tax=Quercus lobata TaxID=97700 RepID=A0A7N2RAN0_QUELO